MAVSVIETSTSLTERDAVVVPRKCGNSSTADRRITFAVFRTMSQYDSILSQLYEILGPYTPDGHSLSEDTEFISDLGLDSMKVMQLLLDTEERFDVSIPLNIIPDVRTVGHFARCVQQLVDRR
jgi:acyl carrier protein